MGRCRRVLFALKIASDHVEADVGGRGRPVVMDVDVAADCAAVCDARAEVVVALEVADDPGVGPDVAAVECAVVNIDVASDGYPAPQGDGRAVSSEEVASNRRPSTDD